MDIKDIYAAVLEFNFKAIEEKVQAALDNGADVQAILNDGLIAPLDEVGRRFSRGDLFMPEMLRAANAMKKGLEVLRPHLENADALSKGTVVLGTVKGDLHDIGKNLVGMMLEGGGFKVVDLGVDVGPDQFIAAVEQSGALAVGLSALLTTTMPAMKAIIAAIREKGLVVKTMVGEGSPTKLQTPVLYLDVSIKKASLYQKQIPDSFRGFVYVIEGELKLNGELFVAGDAAFFDKAELLSFLGVENSHAILCFGQPHGEPIYQHGPYVD